MCHPGQLLAKIKELTRSDRPIMQMSFRSTIRSMIGNIKKLIPPKTGMQKKQVLQHPGYVRGVEGQCCMLHGILARLYKYNIILCQRYQKK